MEIRQQLLKLQSKILWHTFFVDTS